MKIGFLHNKFLKQGMADKSRGMLVSFFILIFTGTPILLPLNSTCQQTGNLDQSIQKNEAVPPFEIKLVYDEKPCDGSLVSIKVINGQPPFFWHELDAEGKEVSILVNPERKMLKEHTTYVVEDAWDHFDTVTIVFSKAVSLDNIYPNPVRDYLTFDVHAGYSLPVQLTFYDLTGRPVNTISEILEAGTAQVKIDLSFLSKGVYIMVIRSGCFNRTEKLLYAGR